MTERAKQAPVLMASLKLLIGAKGANSLMKEEYKPPKIGQAKDDLNEQEERIEKFKGLQKRFDILDEEIKALETPPAPDDPRLVEPREIMRQTELMRWQGRDKEIGLKEKMEGTLKSRMNALELDQAKVAEVQSQLERIGVPKDIRDLIERELENVDDPGKRLKVIITSIEEGCKGDQNSVQEQIVEGMKRLPPAKDKNGIEKGVMQIKTLISDWQRSVNLDEGNKMQFPNKTACDALERLCMEDQAAIAIVRQCKTDSTKSGFAAQAKAVMVEMDRLEELMRLAKGEKKTIIDPETEYKDSKESAVLAMGAVKTMQPSEKICIPFNNSGSCNKGNDCFFKHERTGYQMNYPTPRGYGDVGRSRDKEGDRPLGRDNRGDNRGGGGGSGGGGSYGRTEKRGEKQGDNRHGGRDRSRSPDRGNYRSSSSSSSSSSSAYRNQDRGERDRQRSRSNSSVRSDSSDNYKATPTKEKEKWEKRPDTPKR